MSSHRHTTPHRGVLSATMGMRTYKQSYAGWFSGRYRLLSVFIVTCFIFLSSQQVLSRLQRSFSIPRPEKIPAKIWQSWKVDALHFEDRDLDRARTWARKNPSHRYELLTDYSAIPYVEQAFGCGPGGLCRSDIVNTYNALNDNLKIIQADLLRYIIMYVDGGLWADIDVEAIQPIKTFIPRRFDERDVDMVIGIETDEPDLENHPGMYKTPSTRQSCMYVLLTEISSPGKQSCILLPMDLHVQAWLAGHDTTD